MLRLTQLLSSLFVFLCLSIAVKASALTTAIGPNERSCFYADVDKAGEKIGVSAKVLIISHARLMR